MLFAIKKLYSLGFSAQSVIFGEKMGKLKRLQNLNWIGINSKWLIPFFLLSIQFGLHSSVGDECESKLQNMQSEDRYAVLLADCKKISAIMKQAIKCSDNLLRKKYDIKESGSESTEESSAESEAETASDNQLFVFELKNRCEQEKQSAAECCNNPSSCNGFALDLAQYVAPLTPALLGAYKSYKISDDANKGNLSHQEAVNKLCNAQNTVQLSMFGTNLMSQLTPLMQKTCGDNIKKCRAKCNSAVDEFKKDFMKCYAKLLPDKDILAMVNSAKACFEFEDLKLETIEFSADNFFEDDGRKNICDFLTTANKKGFFISKAFQNGPGNTDKMQNTALAKLLYMAKAYQQTTENKASRLSDKSNEKEIIDCGHQPDRVVTSSNRPSGPVPPPAIQLCQQAVDHAVNNAGPPPLTPGGNFGNQQGNMGQTGSLAGNTRGSNLAPLQVPAGEECQYGALDAESLENCPINLPEEDFDVNNKPGLAKNPPSWKGRGSGSGSSSGGGGGGGLGGGGLGGLTGDDYSSQRGSMYPSYSGDRSVGSSFPGGYESDSYGEGRPSDPPYRDLVKNSDNMKGLDGMERPFPEEENPNEERSIFQMASDRIQNFCNDYSCD